MGRLRETVDVARVMAFLATDLSEWIDGQVIRVNGGFTVCWYLCCSILALCKNGPIFAANLCCLFITLVWTVTKGQLYRSSRLQSDPAHFQKVTVLRRVSF